MSLKLPKDVEAQIKAAVLAGDGAAVLTIVKGHVGYFSRLLRMSESRIEQALSSPAAVGTLMKSLANTMN